MYILTTVRIKPSLAGCFRLIWCGVMFSKIYENMAFTERHSTFSSLIPDHDIFTTMSITNMQDCKTLCIAVTSCVLVNYRIRGHLCKLEHNTGGTQYSVIDVKTAGYMSWRKEFNTPANAMNLCPNCNKTNSCMVEPKTSECGPYACGPFYRYDSKNVLGNIQTLGGKIMFSCFHTTGKMCFFQCSKDGVWLGFEDTGGYEEYEINGKSFKLRITNRKMNKIEARKLCANEGAAVTNILTLDKLEFFREISTKLPGTFWINLERIGKEHTLWISSDGREHDVDLTLWVSIREKFTEKKCARSQKGGGWKILDAHCDSTYHCICEKSEN